MKTALVLGAGGFIGSHLVKRLKSEGYWVRGVDLKYPEFSKSDADEFLIYDLRDPRNVEAVMRLDFYNPFDYAGFTFLKKPYTSIRNFDEVYQLAADMGGAGFVFTGEHDADIMHNSATINLNVCEWAVKYGVKKLFYSSSACMYAQEWQIQSGLPGVDGLREDMAYPANPDSEYGWEKLFSERLYLAYARNYGLNIRIARFHNIYGPEGTYTGGREKAPAAMCRKVIECRELIDYDRGGNKVVDGYDDIEVWGDGKQTRSFLYIDDCIDAVRLLMQSDYKEPINIGSEESISINGLAKLAIEFSGKDIQIKNVESNAIGVNGRNSDNTLARQVLNGWEPKYSLKEGLEKTYKWISNRIIVDGLKDVIKKGIESDVNESYKKLGL